MNNQHEPEPRFHHLDGVQTILSMEQKEVDQRTEKLVNRLENECKLIVKWNTENVMESKIKVLPKLSKECTFKIRIQLLKATKLE